MNQAYIITPTEFERFIAEVNKTLTREVEKIKGSVIEKPMTIKEAADYLRIHENTLFKRIRDGVIPPELVHRVDGTAYFLPSELHRFIKQK
jgi:excisionase family DNA binding protein